MYKHIKLRLSVLFICLASIFPHPLLTAYAADSYEIALGIRTETDQNEALYPGQTVSYKLYVDNKKGEAWIRIHALTSSEGLNDSFTNDNLLLCDGWIRRGSYLYLTTKAPAESTLLAADGFNVPDVTESSNASLTVSVRAEAIDVRALTPDFDSDDPWKGQTPDTVTKYTDNHSSGSAGGSGSGGGSGSSGNSGSSGSGGTVRNRNLSAGGLKRYPAPVVNAEVSSGGWYCVDKEHSLWRYGSGSTDYAADGWYYIYNSYAGSGGKTQWFCFDKSGYMLTGWTSSGGSSWYHLHELSDGSLGSLSTGWYTDAQDNKRYYLDESIGLMQSGWKDIGGKSYYFTSLSEIPGPSWVYSLISGTSLGKWIYKSLNARSFGSMYINERTPDGSIVDSDGVKIA